MCSSCFSQILMLIDQINKYSQKRETRHTLYPSPHCPTDIDECANDTVCGNHGFCDNMDGSFRCLCDQGFETSPSGWDCVGEKPVGCPRSGPRKALGAFSPLQILAVLGGSCRPDEFMIPWLCNRAPELKSLKEERFQLPLQLAGFVGRQGKVRPGKGTST